MADRDSKFLAFFAGKRDFGRGSQSRADNHPKSPIRASKQTAPWFSWLWQGPLDAGMTIEEKPSRDMQVKVFLCFVWRK